MTYTLCTYNGNTGREDTYETFEDAKREGDDAWSHLTPEEKRRWTDGDAGACFYISRNNEQDIQVGIAYDYADELTPCVVVWKTEDGRKHGRRFEDWDEAREFYHDLCARGSTLWACFDEYNYDRDEQKEVE